MLDGLGSSDMLLGGSGADTFVYGTGDGNDAIADFRHGDGDRIDLRAWPESIRWPTCMGSRTRPNVVLTFDAGNSLTLGGVSLASLVESDFIFAAPNQPPSIAGNAREPPAKTRR